MKKYLAVILVLVSSFVLSGCTSSQNNDSSTSNSTTEKQKSSLSLRDLIAQNIPQKCTYSGQNEAGTFNSQITISGEKFSQVTTVKSEAGESTLNSISDGQYIYTWGNNSGNTFAMKMKADFSDSSTEPDSTKENVSSSQLDLDSEYQVNCVPTIVTDADFQPPKNIEFIDYSQTIEQWQNIIPEDITDLE